jgi:N-acetylglutamate synthase-like GNAT family acetyltransferase
MTDLKLHRHMKGKYEIKNLVSHPTYWRRGHASNLVKWICQLADLEGAEIGVVTGEAVGFYEKLGFERAESVVIPRNEKYLYDEEIWIATRAVDGGKEK